GRAREPAYRSTLRAGVRPTLFLDVVVAAADVDVNVHPAKAEVRFRDRWNVERTVENAVRSALGTSESGARSRSGRPPKTPSVARSEPSNPARPSTAPPGPRHPRRSPRPKSTSRR